MTYADTITLLLCLFVVLLALHGAKLHGAAVRVMPPFVAYASRPTWPQTAIVFAPLREPAGIPRPPTMPTMTRLIEQRVRTTCSTRQAVVAHGPYPLPASRPP